MIRFLIFLYRYLDENQLCYPKNDGKNNSRVWDVRNWPGPNIDTVPRYKDMYAGAPAGVKSKVKRCLGAVTCLSTVAAGEDYDCSELEEECLDGEIQETESKEGATTMSRIARLECQIELILCRDANRHRDCRRRMSRDG